MDSVETKSTRSIRYRTLDVFRGVGSLWVVTNHACMNTLGIYNPAVVATYNSFFRCFLGVQILFIISGYCIANSAASNLARGTGGQGFARDRFLRIFPPYYLAAAVTILVSVALAFAIRHGWVTSSNFADLDFFAQDTRFYLSAATLMHIPLNREPVQGVYWTLSYELAFYLIVGGFLVRAANRSLFTERVLLNACHVLTVVTAVLLVAARRVPFPLDWWIMFGLGIVAYDIVRHRTNWLAWTVMVAASAALVYTELAGGFVGAVSASRESHEGNRILGVLFCVLLLVCYRFDDTIYRWRVSRMLGSMSRFSYSLFLTHMLSLGLVLQAAKRLPLPSAAWPLVVLAGVAVSIAFARGFDRVAGMLTERLRTRRTAVGRTVEVTEVASAA